MTKQFISHLKRHTLPNKKLSPSFFFKKDGSIQNIIKNYIKSNPQWVFPYFTDITGIVKIPFLHDDEERWDKIQKWLAENCTSAWFTWDQDLLIFMDKSDAALFLIFWSEEIKECQEPL